jgi:hypothetical protein
VDTRAGKGATEARLGLHETGVDPLMQQLFEMSWGGRHGISVGRQTSKRGARLPFYHN